MGRGYLEGGVWKAGWTSGTLKGDPSFSVKQLDPSHKYILYVSYTCPFAHSANIARVLKGLEKEIEVVALEPTFGEEGWAFGKQKDPLHPEYKSLHQVYTQAKHDFTGRVTVPVLYDKDLQAIVSNESVQCIELFNDFYPKSPIDLLAPAKSEATAGEFENLKKTVLGFNTAVYGGGLAPTQQDYEKAVNGVFETLDLLEDKLASSRFIFGAEPTLVDIRAFVTYLRFLFVYRILFRLDKKDYTTYKNLNRFVRDMYQSFHLQATVPDIHDVKVGYYQNFTEMNPKGIVPLGPDFDLNAKA